MSEHHPSSTQQDEAVAMIGIVGSSGGASEVSLAAAVPVPRQRQLCPSLPREFLAKLTISRLRQLVRDGASALFTAAVIAFSLLVLLLIMWAIPAYLFPRQ